MENARAGEQGLFMDSERSWLKRQRRSGDLRTRFVMSRAGRKEGLATQESRIPVDQ